mgnify:CR=1 FL=1
MTPAVVDRFSGQQAVLLVGEELRELVVARDRLPPDCAPGTWLRVTLQEGRLVHAEVDHEATRQARERIAAKLEALRRRQRPG